MLKADFGLLVASCQLSMRWFTLATFTMGVIAACFFLYGWISLLLLRDFLPPSEIDPLQDFAERVSGASSPHAATSIATHIGQNVTIRQVIDNRDSIQPRCHASTLAQAQDECLNTNRIAFICPSPPCDPNKSILAIKDAIVINWRGVVMDLYTQTVYDVSGGCCRDPSKYGEAKLFSPGELYHVQESITLSHRPLIVLAHSHDTSYYHYVVELMGRLALFRDLFDEWIQNSADFYVRGENSFQALYLNLMLCQSMLAQNAASCYADRRQSDIFHSKIFSTVLLPPAPRQRDDLLTQSIMLRLTESACPEPERNSTQVKAKFVVIKRKGMKRAVVNLEDFVKLLRETYADDIDFVLVKDEMLSKMSIEDYAKLFCNANGIMGGHGAGMSNMLWLRPPLSSLGKHVIEIIREDQIGAHYYPELAGHLGCEYTTVRAVLNTASFNAINAPVKLDDLCVAEKSLRGVFLPLVSSGRPISNRCDDS